MCFEWAEEWQLCTGLCGCWNITQSGADSNNLLNGMGCRLPPTPPPPDRRRIGGFVNTQWMQGHRWIYYYGVCKPENSYFLNQVWVLYAVRGVILCLNSDCKYFSSLLEFFQFLPIYFPSKGLVKRAVCSLGGAKPKTETFGFKKSLDSDIHPPPPSWYVVFFFPVVIIREFRIPSRGRGDQREFRWDSRTAVPFQDFISLIVKHFGRQTLSKKTQYLNINNAYPQRHMTMRSWQETGRR